MTTLVAPVVFVAVQEPQEFLGLNSILVTCAASPVLL